MVHPNRKARSSLIQQNTGTSRLHQEATGGRQQNNRNYEPAACEKETPKHSKLSKIKRQRITQQMKEQGKNPPHQTNEEERGSLPEKRIHSNDSKDDPETWK